MSHTFSQMPHTTIISLSDLEPSVQDHWRRMVQQHALNPTLDLGWLDVAVRSIGKGSKVSLFLSTTDAGIPTALVPFFTSKTRMGGLTLTLLQPASNIFSYHADVVADDPAECLSQLLGAVKKWDVLHFSNVDVDGRLASAMQIIATRVGAKLQIIPGERSPYLTIDAGWDQFLAGKQKKFRYGVRHRKDLVAKAGGRQEWFTDLERIDQLLQDILAVEKHSWKADIGKDIPANAVEVAYHDSLFRYLAAQRALFANVLYIDDRPAAYCLCCRFGGWVGNLKTSFVEQHAAVSPGAFVIDAAIQRAFAEGATEFDFLGDLGQHKLAWASAIRTHAGYFLFAPTWKARIVFLLKRAKAWLAEVKTPKVAGP